VSKFRTTTEKLPDAVVIRVRGYLSGHGGERLEEEIDRLLEEGCRNMIINFSATDLVNSVGVSILIGVIEKTKEVDCRLSFAGLTPVNEEIFRLMGLDQHVPFIRGGGNLRGSQGGDEP
jgi:anti-anti-sigma factor